jgi:hypothetical protein
MTATLPRPEGATSAVWAAYKVAEDASATPARLVLALSSLDRDMGMDVSDWSRAADSARDAAELVARGERARWSDDLMRTLGLRADRRAQEAAELMGRVVDASPVDQMRAMLIGRLVAAGVHLTAMDGSYCLGVADHYATLIRSGRDYAAAISRRNQGLNRASADLDDMLAAVRTELSAAGIPGL